MIKNKESLVKQFRSDDPSTYLSNEDQQKAMLLDTISAAKVKPKNKHEILFEARGHLKDNIRRREKNKRVVETIEIPEIISVPRRQPIIKTEVIESYNTGPQIPIGLSQRFTQDRLREGQILKQIDREMAIESKNDQTTNEEEND